MKDEGLKDGDKGEIIQDIPVISPPITPEDTIPYTLPGQENKDTKASIKNRALGQTPRQNRTPNPFTKKRRLTPSNSTQPATVKMTTTNDSVSKLESLGPKSNLGQSEGIAKPISANIHGSELPYITQAIKVSHSGIKSRAVWIFQCGHYGDTGRQHDQLNRFAEWMPKHCHCR